MLSFAGRDEVEKMIGYSPRKIEVVAPGSPEYGPKRKELIDLYAHVMPNEWLVKSDSDFFWVLNRKKEGDVLFKYHGSADDLEYIKHYEPISRKVTYAHYLFAGKLHTVVGITGYDEVKAILNHYASSSQTIYHRGKTFVRLQPDMYLLQYFPGSCRIYPDLETFDFETDQAAPPSIKIDDSIYDYEKNIDSLSRIFDVRLDARKISREDLSKLALKVFDYTKEGNIVQFYPLFCSVMAKYLLDNFGGKLSIEQNEAWVIKGSDRYEVNLCVSNTINNLVSYEYNPDLYFQVFPDL